MVYFSAFTDSLIANGVLILISIVTVQHMNKSPRISRIFTDLIHGFFLSKKNPWKSVKSVATCSYAELLLSILILISMVYLFFRFHILISGKLNCPVRTRLVIGEVSLTTSIEVQFFQGIQVFFKIFYVIFYQNTAFGHRFLKFELRQSSQVSGLPHAQFFFVI